MKWATIQSIEPAGMAECACIAVSHPSRLYITDNGIVTHNTTVDRNAPEAEQSGDEPPDSPHRSLRFQAVSDSQLSETERKILSAVRADEKNAGIGAARVALPAVSGAEGVAPAEFLRELKRVFGKDVLFIHPGTGTKPINFDGASPPDHRNTIVVDATTKKPLLTVLGHELVHALKAQRVDLWNELRPRLLALASDWSDYQRRLRRMNYTDEQMVDEFLGDFIGGQFREPEFWQKMEAKNQPLFQAMARAALDFLNRILNRLAGVSRDVRGYFSDIEASRQVLVETLEKYASDRRFPDRTLLEGDNSELSKSVAEEALKTMRLVSTRMADATTEMQALLNEHKATADGRTIDGNPIEAAGYLVRKDADMQAAADKWLDTFDHGQGAAGKSQAESREALVSAIKDGTNPEGGAPLSLDVAAFILTRLIQERGPQFGFDSAELDALYQQKAGQAGAALRQGRLILDPLKEVVDEANKQTGTKMVQVLGGDAAGLNGELQSELLSESTKALEDALAEAQARGGELEKLLADAKSRQEASAQELAAEKLRNAEETKRLRNLLKLTEQQVEALESRPSTSAEADARIAEKLAKAREELRKLRRDLKAAREQPALGAADSEGLERFERWLAGGKVDGIDTLKELAAKFLLPQRWDAERFRQYIGTLFPTIGEDILDAAAEIIRSSLHDSGRSSTRRKESRDGNEPSDDDTGVSDVTARAQRIIDRLATTFSDTPTFGKSKGADALRQLVSQAISAKDEMADLKERAMALGVADETASALVRMVIEARRRKDAVATANKLSRMEAARQKAVGRFIDKLNERGAKREAGSDLDSKFAKFFQHLSRAADFGVLDSQLFSDAFAHAWGLHGLTAANVMRMRQIHQQITATGPNAIYGMKRETLERRFVQALNSLLPGQSLNDFVFNSYQAGVLASVSSMINQFSAVARILTPLDAVARASRLGQTFNPQAVLGEWLRGAGGLLRNLPFMLTAIRDESLGHLPSRLASGHVPTEQRTQLLAPGERVRIGGATMSGGLSALARYKELWTWRGIRAAEGLTGLVDADSHFVETLAAHYRNQPNTTPQAAYRRALAEIYQPSAADWSAAVALARQEQAAGEIGRGEHVVRRRAQEHINRGIELRAQAGLVARTEQLNGFTQFKTMPLGPIGFAVANFMSKASNSDHTIGRAARYWLLFGRFLGHAVDMALAYNPLTFQLTAGNQSLSRQNSRRLKTIKEVFGSVEAYDTMVRSRATSGAAFLLGTGALMALALEMADDDEEPFFAITGSAPGETTATRQALQATGQWGEMQIRINGKPVLGYSQLPELAPLLLMLGNLSDAIRFDKALNQRASKKDGEPVNSKVREEVGTIGATMLGDVITAPIKRSTYRQWFDALDALMQGDGTFLDKVGSIATRPLDGALRFPLVVDADKIADKNEGNRVPDDLADAILRRVPFVQTGLAAFNAYGERLPGWDVVGALPTEPEFSERARRAAVLNIETGTVRGKPDDPTATYDDERIREVPEDQREAFQRISGQLYTESLLRHEAEIRRAYAQGGQGSAAKIVQNISSKANKEAKKQLGLE